MHPHIKALIEAKAINADDKMSIAYSEKLMSLLPSIFKEGFMMTAPVGITQDNHVVPAQVYAMSAVVSAELQNDLKLIMGVNFEDELQHIITQEIAYEYARFFATHEINGQTIRPYVPIIVHSEKKSDGIHYNFSTRFGSTVSDKPFL